MFPLISVIVPIWNVAEYLPACIESLLQQTYPNLEIILIEDGSPDNCGRICDQFAEKDSRIKVIHQTNQGLSAARNAGIACASGRWICFVDGDDWVSSGYVSGLWELMQRNQAELSVCGMTEVFPDGTKAGLYCAPKEQVLSGLEAMERMLYRKGIGFSVCNKLFPKRVFEGLDFPEGKIFEDFALSYRLLARCRTVAWGTEALYWYRSREDSITNRAFSPSMLDILEHARQMKQEIGRDFPAYCPAADCAAAYARFTLLRRLCGTKEEPELMKQLLRESRKSVPLLMQPKVSWRDKAAVVSAFFGADGFALCWAAYDRIRSLFKNRRKRGNGRTP